MEEIFTFAQTISPVGVIAILAIIIYQLVDGRTLLSKIRGTQEEKYPELEKHFAYLEESYANQKKFQENHSMHEIPAIVETVNRIENKIDKMADIQYTQGMDIARLKALSEK